MKKLKNFDVICDSSLYKLCGDTPLSVYDEKDFLLSVINGFEDGKWRQSEFIDFVMNNLAFACLSAEERDSLYDDPFSVLRESIKNLRFVDGDAGEGSEIAEIVLYGILHHHFKALPVIPKIFYKQNHQDNAKGADSVHIVLDDSGDFSLWLGEAKFYNSIEDKRLHEIINSVFDAISTEKIRKENAIVTNIKDLDLIIRDAILRKKIKEVLHLRTSIDEIKKRLHVPIMLLHECKKTQNTSSLSEEYVNSIQQFHLERAKKYFSLQNTKQKNKSVFGYENINFHLILFPVPNKEKIVNIFSHKVKAIGSYE